MNTKRMIALFCAAAAAVSCTACGKSSAKQTGPEVSLDHSYTAVALGAEEISDIYNICSVGDKYLITGWNQDYSTNCYMLYDPNDDSMHQVSLQFLEKFGTASFKEGEGAGAGIVDAVTSSAGDVYIFYTSYTYSEESFDEQGVTVEKYDADMNLKDTIELKNAFNKESPNNISSVCIDSKDNLFVGTYTPDGKPQFNIYDLSFKQTGTVDISDAQYVDQVFQTGDGKIACQYSDMNYDPKYGYIDTESKKFSPIETEGLPNWTNGGAGCTGDYDFCVYDSEALYGVRSGQPAETMMDWINSDFLGDYVRAVQPLKDGRILVACSDTDYKNCQLYVCTERSKEELDKIQMLSLAAFYPSTELCQAVMAYNRSHEDVRIVMKRYDSGDDYEANMESFKNDMTSGVVADLICTDGISFEGLANTGLFLDINELMDSDADFNRDDYFDNYFRAMEYGGKLYRISSSFSVETLIAKEKLINVDIPMTMADFKGIIDGLPSTMTAFREMTRYSVFQNMIINNLDTFMNVEKGECDFNNQQFIELLEFCSSFPEEVMDYENMTDSDWEDYWLEDERRYVDEKALFYSCYLSGVEEYHRITQGDFNGEPVVFTGYPSVDGTGNGGRFNSGFTISISAGTAHKQEAWDFVRTMLSEEVGSALTWSFPVNRNAFKNVAEKQCTPRTYVDENGNTVNEPMYFGGNGNMESARDIGYPTQEEVQVLQSYIEGVTTINNIDNDVYNIIQEETEMFFAGDQSAADCAKMIQSRVNLYINEAR